MWVWLWFLFIVVLFLIPLGYGWGYRGWGFPYPSYYGRRRRPREAGRYGSASESVTEPVSEPIREGWGVLADIIWLALFIGIVWLIVALIV